MATQWVAGPRSAVGLVGPAAEAELRGGVDDEVVGSGGDDARGGSEEVGLLGAEFHGDISLNRIGEIDDHGTGWCGSTSQWESDEVTDAAMVLEFLVEPAIMRGAVAVRDHRAAQDPAYSGEAEKDAGGARRRWAG